MSYDIIIKNGTVFDGTGNIPKKEDIGIKDNEIKKVGDLQKDNADTIIDASGHYVTPGFIDMTTHSDTHWTIFTQPSQESFIRQGITTIFGGNCGISLAPLVKTDNIEGIEQWVDTSKTNINWQTMGEFLSELEKRSLPLNFGTFVGFNTIHWGIIGRESVIPTKDQINQLKFLLNDSIKNGAFGLSTSFGALNRNFSMDKEIIEIFKIAADNGVITKHHLEDEGKNILPSLSQLLNFARESGVKIHLSHLKALGKTGWSYFNSLLAMIENAKKEGINITCDFFPYTSTGSNLYMLLPSWIKNRKPNQILEILRSRENSERKGLLDYFKELTLHYDRITVASAFQSWEHVGKTIQEISDISGLPPEEIVLNLLSANNLRVSIFNEVILEKNIYLLAEKDYSAIASDGVGYDISSNISNKASSKVSSIDLPHPRSFGTFPKALRMFAIERKNITWEKAIYKMTGLPAEILNLEKRGKIKKNNYADIIIFDPKELIDLSNYENPFSFSVGIKYVLINGKIVLKDEKIFEKSAGKLLKN